MENFYLEIRREGSDLKYGKSFSIAPEALDDPRVITDMFKRIAMEYLRTLKDPT